MEFRKMRRFKQELSEQESLEILRAGTHGVLAVAGDDGYPYAVPLSYVYHDGYLYFHCAKQGHKLDAIARNPKASFCVVAADDVKPAEFTTYFRSVICFGTVRVMDMDDAVTLAKHIILSDKYSPGMDAERDAEIASGFHRMLMLEFRIEHMSGKQAKELFQHGNRG